ncbi:MAG: ECF transporter S component [Bacillota bacterium]|nr:ECF transporter S component [Bacillota bacterium]
MALTHEEKRARIFKPDRSDALPMAWGAVLYALVATLTYLIPAGDLLLRPAAVVPVFLGTLYGPVVGFVAGLAGALLVDLFQQAVWIHWAIGNGFIGLSAGLLWLWSDVDAPGPLTAKDASKIIIFAVLGSFGGMFFAGLMDLFFGVPAAIALWTWALPAALSSSFFGGLGGVAAVYLYKNRPWAGRLQVRKVHPLPSAPLRRRNSAFSRGIDPNVAPHSHNCTHYTKKG